MQVLNVTILLITIDEIQIKFLCPTTIAISQKYFDSFRRLGEGRCRDAYALNHMQANLTWM